MQATDVLGVTHWEDTDLVLMARVAGADGVNVNQAALSAVAVYAYDLSTGEQVGATLTPTVASTVFNSLQTDARWTEDHTGYNFRVTVPAAYFPTGGRAYRVEVVFTPVTGSAFPLVAEVDAVALLSS